jgi:RNA polymerase sigma-70 factor (ECF subfamily)
MEVSDQDAVRATLKDANAFTTLVERYQQPLMRYIRRLGIDDEDAAKDILQESFIKAYTNLNDFDFRYAFSAWMYRITHNETMSHFRRLRSRPHVVRNEADLAIFELIADELDIAKETDAKLSGEAITKALEGMKSEYRDVLVLRFFEGKSYEEISDILRLPAGTVATHLARAKRELRQRLKEYRITDVY